MTIQQIIDVPASRKVHFDVLLPDTVPCGRTEVIIDFPQAKGNLDPALERALNDAEEKRLYNKAHPAELRESLKMLQKGNPLFGGIGADEFKRRNRNEWEDRI